MPAYPNQVARAYRFLDRYKAARHRDFWTDPGVFNDVEDYLWSFFQHCWHIKDWVRHDDSLPQATRDAVWKSIKASRVLHAVADLANGSKHFARDPSKEWIGANEGNIELPPGGAAAGGPTHWVDVNDAPRVPAHDLAEEAMAEWQKILRLNGLEHFVEAEARGEQGGQPGHGA